MKKQSRQTRFVVGATRGKRKMKCASVSFGKDSLAMLLRMLDDNWELDKVLFYNTGMEFDCIYKIRDAVKKILEKKNIDFVELHPKEPFLYSMLERDVFSKRNGHHKGYGWCGGVTRWGTTEKIKTLDQYKCDTMYVGIASDEQKRLVRLDKTNKMSPLAFWGMTESDCLEYCYNKGFYWIENGRNLYDYLDRVSCWCCANKNKKELTNIKNFFPTYWNKLQELQKRICKPLNRGKWYQELTTEEKSLSITRKFKNT